ncbi:SMI1/KNR4 family protein [Kitasatospora sp. NPDC059646]|uniref:SMI1/KNR4 family protein n=1 Tax=Kitasatospora sp. NPDC059646 TaxID=3346893 RepID=UPI0036863973
MTEQVFDAARVLGEGVPDRGRAWEFLHAFAAAWTTPLTDADGVPDGELERAQARLGLRFPAALREFYTLLGTRTDLTENQDPLLPPGEVFVHDEFGGVLVFRAENQGCAYWGVRLEDLGRDDPPVFVQSRDGWLPFMDRLSLAALELILSESLFAESRFYNACELPADLIETLPHRFKRLALPDYPLWTGLEDSPVRWYSAPGVLLRLDGGEAFSWLHVVGRTRAGLEALEKAFPARWALGYPRPAPVEVDDLPF